MRLQSAIIDLDTALLDGDTARAGADRVLSILKMEGVWMYAVTAMPRAQAEDALRSAGLDGFFRGILTETEALCPLYSETMLEKALRRLRAQRVDTVVFSGALRGVETAKAAGLRAVAVGGTAGESEWSKMCMLADYELAHYADWFKTE